MAAPTAGLHFSEQLLRQLDAGLYRRVAVTLHVRGRHLPAGAGR